MLLNNDFLDFSSINFILYTFFIAEFHLFVLQELIFFPTM